MAVRIMYLFLMVFCLSCPQIIQATISQFKLFTPGSSSPETISAGNLGNRFNASQKLTFLIHGFIHTGSTQWIQKMRAELMKREKMNIVVVDWSQGSVAMYHVATKNTRVVGSEIAALIQQLHRRYNYTLAKIHVIGHSLGAHVAGFAGAKVQAILAGKKLGRITGLDPAGPSFDHNNKRERLDPSDAQFVDVIHTDVGSLGLERACGHVDFYPNGGIEQPGCSTTDLLSFDDSLGGLSASLNAFKKTLPYSPNDICDHLKVLDFFTASINNNQCRRKAFPCKDWQAFKQGKCHTPKCRGTCAEMGYNAGQYHRSNTSKPFSKFYLRLLDNYPFCGPRYSYYVTLYKVSSPSSFLLIGNEVKIQLHGQNDKTVKLNNIKSGTSSHMIASDTKLHPLRKISVWYKSGTTLDTLYIGKVIVIGPESKYKAEYNTRLSSGTWSGFFFFNTWTPGFKIHTRKLQKIK